MSYSIVKHRFVARIHENIPANSRSREHDKTHFLFIEFSSSNNVSPRTFDGWIIASDSSYGNESVRYWMGKPLLPCFVWECAYHADQGGIKAYPNRELTGTGYISSWKQQAECPVELVREDGSLTIPATIFLSLPEGTAQGFRPAFDTYEEETVGPAWDRLFSPLIKGRDFGKYESRRTLCTTARSMLDAMTLRSWMRSDKGIGSCSVTWCDYQAKDFARLQPEAPAKKPKTSANFKPNTVIELYGTRYTLTGKRKASWLGTNEKTGQLTKIGPSHWKNATIIEKAA